MLLFDRVWKREEDQRKPQTEATESVSNVSETASITVERQKKVQRGTDSQSEVSKQEEETIILQKEAAEL